MQKQLATLTEQTAGRADRVADANARAKAIEDQIFEINQPPARKYELIRVTP
ncbi:MAG: hypothetical protein R3B90_16190 [Planctomycetaceae bacterium]